MKTTELEITELEMTEDEAIELSVAVVVLDEAIDESIDTDD